MTKTLIEKLAAQADGLALNAEAYEIVVKHFQPRFDACWNGDGDLIDGPLALRLQPLVSDYARMAKQWREEEKELREAIERLNYANEVLKYYADGGRDCELAWNILLNKKGPEGP